MKRDPIKLRFTDKTPPIDLWRTYPLWEFCVGEEGIEVQHEGTIRPSEATHWNSVFDHSQAYDLAAAFGEAEFADGRVLPAEVDLGASATSGKHGMPSAIYIYFQPPKVTDRYRWTL